MAFDPSSFTGAANIAPIGLPGVASWADQFKKGFGVSQLPKEAERMRLANAMQQLLVDEEPQKFKSEQALRSAQIANALQPAKPDYTDTENLIRGYQSIIGQYGEGSPQAQMAKAYIQHKSGGIGGGAEGIDPLTTTTRTTHQNIIASTPKVLDALDAIDKAASPASTAFWKPGDKATHDALVGEALESFVTAKGWPKTDSSMKEAKKILERNYFESDSHYRERLKDLKKSLKEQAGQSKNILRSGGVGTTQESAEVTAPTMPESISNSAQFKQWLSTLTPQQQAAAKQEHLGGY